MKYEIQKNNDPDPAKITIEVDACVESITVGVCGAHAPAALSNQYLLSNSNTRNERLRPCERAPLLAPTNCIRALLRSRRAGTKGEHVQGNVIPRSKNIKTIS